VRRLALLLLLAALPGCGDDRDTPAAQSGKENGGLSLSVSFDDPLRANQPVTWTLEVENGGPAEAVLTFRSGKDGDVSLLQGGREAYRWSATRFFSQAIRQVPIGPGERKSYTLEEKAFSAAAGDYELVADLASEPAPPPARRAVTVEKG
jgi:hypothetical protein